MPVLAILKNQLTGNFFGLIMHSGVVLVLKWYLLVYRFFCLWQGLQHGSARVRRHGARRWGTTAYLDAPGFFDVRVYPKLQGKKKRHRLFLEQALSRHGPENA